MQKLVGIGKDKIVSEQRIVMKKLARIVEQETGILKIRSLTGYRIQTGTYGRF